MIIINIKNHQESYKQPLSSTTYKIAPKNNNFYHLSNLFIQIMIILFFIHCFKTIHLFYVLSYKFSIFFFRIYNYHTHYKLYTEFQLIILSFFSPFCNESEGINQFHPISSPIANPTITIKISTPFIFFSYLILIINHTLSLQFKILLFIFFYNLYLNFFILYLDIIKWKEKSLFPLRIHQPIPSFSINFIFLSLFFYHLIFQCNIF